MTGSEPPDRALLPFSNSYWVVPGRFLAGGYPGRRDPDEVMRNIIGLLDSGIRHVISLMEAHEVAFLGKYITCYENELEYILRRTGRALTVSRIPIEDMSVPTRRTMLQILDEIDLAIDHGRPVFVHCLGGRGRTGTVVGCYLVRHGMTGQEALAQIKQLRQTERTGPFPSPETRSQREMVLTWHESSRA